MSLLAGTVPCSLLFGTQREQSNSKGDKPPLKFISLTTWPEFCIDMTGYSWDDDCDQFINAYIAELMNLLSKDYLSRLAERHELIGWGEIHS